jgi:uncharacterized protein YndB with AHSA1/START domain
MISVEKSVYIACPAEDVFHMISNVETYPDWQADVEFAERVTEGELGVGSQSRIVRRAMGREMDSIFELTAYEPSGFLTVKSVGGPVTLDISWTLVSENGGTQATITIDGEMSGFFKLAEGMITKQLGQSLEDQFANLKAILE